MQVSLKKPIKLTNSRSIYLKTKSTNLNQWSKPPETKACFETGDRNKKASFRNVEFSGYRLKPLVVSLVVVVKKTNSRRIPFESRISESIDLLNTIDLISEETENNNSKMTREKKKKKVDYHEVLHSFLLLHVCVVCIF